jgi:FkbM family methyltransferase
MFLQKISQLLARKQTARKWGIKFNRVRDFQIPQHLKLEGKEVEIDLPAAEAGMLAEFVEIILDDCYQLKSWKKRLKPEIKILDIGGNVGLFSLAARQFFPQAIIHTYEPNSSLEKYLYHQSQLANFDYYLKALGAKDGQVRLQFSDKGSSCNTVSIYDEKGNIPMMALSKAIDNLGGHVDLAKIDCEGAEWELFEASDVWHKMQNITMEYHLYKKKHTLEKLQETITKLGFKIESLQPTNQYYGNLIASRSTN